MTGDTIERIRADKRSRKRMIIAVAAASVGVLAVAALGVFMLFKATTARASSESPWQSLPTVPGTVVVAELPGQHSDDGNDYWVRQVQAPSLSGSQLTAAYTTVLTQAGWQLLESYPAQDGSGFSRVCFTSDDSGAPRLVDIRAYPPTGSQLDRVEIAVSARSGSRSVCGDVFGQFTWPEAAKPAG